MRLGYPWVRRFWKNASKLEMQTIEYLLGIFVTREREIKQADPRAAVALGLMS